MKSSVNWIPDQNPYQLSKPPTWWLTELLAFDMDLRILPSREQPYYRLLRLTRRGPGVLRLAMPQQLERASPSPDTLMAWQYQAVPVTTIYPQGLGITQVLAGGKIKIANNVRAETFTRQQFVDLRARDTWAVGGSKRAADLLDQRDRDSDQHRRDKSQSDTRHAARDMYRSYSSRTGERLSQTKNPQHTGLKRKPVLFGWDGNSIHPDHQPPLNSTQPLSA